MAKQLNIGDRAPAARLLNMAGQDVALTGYFTGKLTLLTFLRHFG